MPLSVDRVTQLAEAVDVAAEGTHGDVESLSQLIAWPVAVGLEQGE